MCSYVLFASSLKAAQTAIVYGATYRLSNGTAHSSTNLRCYILSLIDIIKRC